MDIKIDREGTIEGFVSILQQMTADETIKGLIILGPR